jgi:hypothetical protein
MIDGVEPEYAPLSKMVKIITHQDSAATFQAALCNGFLIQPQYPEINLADIYQPDHLPTSQNSSLQKAAMPTEFDLESIGATSSMMWAMILKNSLQHPNKQDTPLQSSHVSPPQKQRSYHDQTIKNLLLVDVT